MQKIWQEGISVYLKRGSSVYLVHRINQEEHCREADALKNY